MTTTSTLDYGAPTPVKTSKLARTAGWILSLIPGLFLGSAVIMIFMPDMVRDGMTKQRFADPVKATWIVLGLEIMCAVIYLIPRTAVLGAVLMTGYLGGAIATHLRGAEYKEMIPAIVLGVMVWLGLFLREPRLRVLLPLRSQRRIGG